MNCPPRLVTSVNPRRATRFCWEWQLLPWRPFVGRPGADGGVGSREVVPSLRMEFPASFWGLVMRRILQRGRQTSEGIVVRQSGVDVCAGGQGTIKLPDT
jgi:hypothetical protein